MKEDKKGGKDKDKEQKDEGKKDKGGKEKEAPPCCGGDSEDASITNSGFYLSGNALQGGSNIIIYGSGPFC